MLDQMTIFFDSPFFNIVGGISTILMVVGFFYTLYLIIKGVFPVWYRLGVGLSRSKIAIFSSKEFVSLKNMLISSKIFKEYNIIQISNNNDFEAAKNTKIFLVHWKDFQDEIQEILNIKGEDTALIIYAPLSEGRIENNEILNKINQKRNSVIVNFRGRLLNDILISLITTSYEQR